MEYTQILSLIRDFTQDASALLIPQLQRVKQVSEQDKAIINKQIVKILREALQNIIKGKKQPQYTPILRSLLQSLFYGLKIEVISLSSILGFIDDIFDCLPLCCLQHLFEIVETQMTKIQIVLPTDQNTLLRITNGMLKRIPKSDNIEFRGRLHLLLSKILRLCHDSGMVKHEISQNQIGQLDRQKTLQTAQQFSSDKQNSITYKFYTRFWGLQKYFSNPSLTLFSQQKDPQLLNDDLQSQQYALINPKRRLLVAKLKAVIQSISQILRVFMNNPVLQSENLQYHLPVKHLTGQNLLQTQLGDPHFRRLFVIQSLLFCHNLLNTNTKHPLNLFEQQKNMVSIIQKQLKQYIKDTSRIDGFFESDKYWTDLKQNWKNRKSTLQLNLDQKIQSQLQYLSKCKNDPSFTPQFDILGRIINPSSKNLYDKHSSFNSEVHDKLNLQGSKMKAYIQFQSKIESNPLSTKALWPSFYYYYEDSLRALQSLNESQTIDEVFQNRAVYSQWEWKSLKALAKQSIKDLQADKKDQLKYKQYKLLSIVKRKEEEFGEIATKKLRTDEANNEIVHEKQQTLNKQ